MAVSGAGHEANVNDGNDGSVQLFEALAAGSGSGLWEITITW